MRSISCRCFTPTVEQDAARSDGTRQSLYNWLGGTPGGLVTHHAHDITD
jgi:hypothetical protein